MTGKTAVAEGLKARELDAQEMEFAYLEDLFEEKQFSSRHRKAAKPSDPDAQEYRHSKAHKKMVPVRDDARSRSY